MEQRQTCTVPTSLKPQLRGSKSGLSFYGYLREAAVFQTSYVPGAADGTCYRVGTTVSPGTWGCLGNPALLDEQQPAILAQLPLPNPRHCHCVYMNSSGHARSDSLDFMSGGELTGGPGALGVMLTSSATAARAASRVACVRGRPVSAASTRRAMMVRGATPPYATPTSSTVHSPADGTSFMHLLNTPKPLDPNPTTIGHDCLGSNAPTRHSHLLHLPIAQLHASARNPGTLDQTLRP